MQLHAAARSATAVRSVTDATIANQTPYLCLIARTYTDERGS
jgi:hypothetical protein